MQRRMYSSTCSRCVRQQASTAYTSARLSVTINLDDGLVREAMALYRGKTKTAVVELGLQELINADRRRRLGEAFGSQPDLVPVARRRAAPDPT